MKKKTIEFLTNKFVFKSFTNKKKNKTKTKHKTPYKRIGRNWQTL